MNPFQPIVMSGKGSRFHAPRLFAILAAAPSLTASACAAPLDVHKAANLPALHPLPLSASGRMLRTPAANASSLGGIDFTYQWPGIAFRAAFAGTRVYFRVVATNKTRADEILHIVVDGQPPASLVKPEPGVYEVEGLTSARHTIGVFLATESLSGTNTFGGFAIPATEQPLAPPQRHRQMEFIGDSHTVGYGNLSPTRTCTEDQVWADTDDTQAFGAIVASHYDADDQINAISGRGVVRNYNGFQADTLPQAYPWVLFDRKQKYSDPAWKPQVIVITLGTNDFTTPLNPGERWKTRDELHADFEATYARFLEELRARNPAAFILVWATNAARGEVEAEAQKVVTQRSRQGDADIAFLPIDGLSFGACNSHPTLADDQIIAQKLEQQIDAHRPFGPSR